MNTKTIQSPTEKTSASCVTGGERGTKVRVKLKNVKPDKVGRNSYVVTSWPVWSCGWENGHSTKETIGCVRAKTATEALNFAMAQWFE